MKNNRLLSFSVLILMFVGFNYSSAKILRSYDAERNFTDRELYMMDNCGGGDCNKYKSFEPVINPPGVPVLSDKYAKNNKCAKMYFPGCQNSTSHNFCTKVMSDIQPQTSFPVGTTVWHAFSIFVPEDFYESPGGYNLVYQFHGWPDDLGTCDNWRTPVLAIYLSKGKWVVKMSYDNQRCGHGQKERIAKELTTIVKGSWTHFVIQARFNAYRDALCRIWIKDPDHPNATQVCDYKGRMGYDDEQMPYNYVSFGLYKPPWGDEEITLYFDRIIVGDNTESMSSMMYNEDPAGDKIPPEIKNVDTNINGKSVTITFSEAIDKVSAENIKNYDFNHEFSILSAVLGADKKSVTVNTPQLIKNTIYKLIVNDIYDLAEPPNKIAADTEVSFVYKACLNGSLDWQNSSIPTQYGLFTAECDVIPSRDAIDGIIALSSGQGNTFNDFAVLIRFNNQGKIDIRNGSSYSSDASVAFSAGKSYHLRMVVNTLSQLYSVYLTHENKSETTLATDYAFRSEQASISKLDNCGAWAYTGNIEVCGLTIKDITGIKKISEVNEKDFFLSAYKSPFSSNIEISFNLLQSGKLKISIYNIKGSLIQTLYSGRKESGSYNLTWNGLNKHHSQVPSGIYLVSLDSEDISKQISIIIRH